MPIKKYMMRLDGVERQVSEDKFKKYGPDAYHEHFENAVIRMVRDGKEYSMPVLDYEKALLHGYRPFITTYYDSNEKIDATHPSDSIAYLPPKEISATPNVVDQKNNDAPVVPSQNENNTKPTTDWSFSDEEKEALSQQLLSVEKPKSGGVGTQEEADSIFDSRRREWQASQQKEDDTQGKKVEDDTEIRKDRAAKPSVLGPTVYDKMAADSFAAFQENQQRELDKPVSEWQGTPSQLPETKREAMVKPERERQMIIENIWNGELKDKVDQLIKAGEEEGRKRLNEYEPAIYGRNNFGYGMAGIDDRWGQEYLKATDAKKVIDGVQQYLAEKQSQGETSGEGSTATEDPIQRKLMQKVYDYLVQKNTPRSTAEYILRNVMDTSILGQLAGLGNGKSYEQRQIEAQGLQQYDASTGEEIGAMAASIATDLPVMRLTGAIGGLAGNALLKGATNRLMASGLSEAAARGIATRAAQQGAMKWGLRTASEALNFGTLEGAGSAVGQLYQTGEVDLADVAQSFAKGTATGAIMGVFGVSNDNFRRMMEGTVGETAGRAIGYGTSLGGRTAILTGSSVFGQYLADPNFDINNVDWTKEISHAALMNIGFDILGAAKRYQAERKTGIKMRDLEKLNLTKEDIAQLNRAGIQGKNAQEIAENILQTKDAAELRKSAETGEGLVGNDWTAIEQELALNKDAGVMGELLGNPNIDLQTKAKVAYLLTGVKMNLSPSTNISEVEEQADGSYTVTKFDPSGQTNETRRYSTREEAEKARYDMQNEVMPNQVNVLERMMDDAGRTASAIRIFEMVAKQFGVSKEQMTVEYVRGRNGEPLEGEARRAYEMLDNLLKSVTQVEDYHYSIEQLKRRMDDGYGEKSGWMDQVLKKKYNSLDARERQAYDEYISNMKMILQGENAQRETLGNGETERQTEGGLYPMIETIQPEFASNAGPVESPSPTPSSPREVSRQTGAAIYAEHDPIKMRQAVVREQIARERAIAVGVSEETLKSLAQMDDAALEEATAAMDANTKRIVGDWVAQRDMVEGLNDALDDAHEAEVKDARDKVAKMASIGGVIRLVELGKYGDNEHKWGVIVSGVNSEGALSDPNGLAVVVPLANGINGMPDFASFDMYNHQTGTFKGNLIDEFEPDDVTRILLKDYEADANILESASFVPGQSVKIADMDGNVSDLYIFAKGPGDSWIVQEEGMPGTIEMTSQELAEMAGNAERLPIMQEYAEIDALYEQEQTAIRRQQEQQEKELKRQQERAQQKEAEEAEAARIAAEMAKPINRLAKYPEGHPKAGQPDYENSKPEDVRDYFNEWLGPEDSAKSIRSLRKNIEEQIAKKEKQVQKLIVESKENDYFPDEAIKAKQYIDSQQEELNALKKRLSFWEKMELLTSGPSEKAMQEIVNRSEAAQKAKKTRNEIYKPSEAYKKMKKKYSDNQEALNILNDLEPHTPEELAATMISGGIRLMKADETIGDTTLKGVMSMTGYGEKDLNRLNFIFATRANGGISVSEFGEMMEVAAKEYGIRFDGKTQEEGVTALLNLLGEVEKMGDITRYVENNRMEEATSLFDAENAAIESAMETAAWNEYGMSYEDLTKLQDAITSVLESRKGFYEEFTKSEAYNKFISTFAENNNNYGIERNDDESVGTRAATDERDDTATGGQSVERDQSAGGTVFPSGEVAEGQQSDADVQRGTTVERKADGDGNNASLPAGQELGGTEKTGGYQVEKHHHAQQNKDIWAVKFDERFDRDKFLELKDEAKKYGGYYSRFGKGGFIFKTEEDARKFGESVVGVEAAPVKTEIEKARAEVNTNPTEAQKEAGNYKMGHVKLDGYDITIENPKGSVRSGKDANGKAWSITMNNDYGYIRGTEAVDGDHIDVFLSDTPEEGAVFVVDQAKEDGSFDESKVMYGFGSMDEARNAYLSNYSKGWENRIIAITEVSKDEFKKWIDSSHRKTKAFSEYKSVKAENTPSNSETEKANKPIEFHGGDKVFSLKHNENKDILMAHHAGEKTTYMFTDGTSAEAGEVEQARKEPVINKEYDEQGRETIESQAGHSASQAAELENQAEAGRMENAPATGRGSGTSGNRPVASGSERPTQVNGYRLGEKVVYKGKEATIYDFEKDGTPVLDTGMAPVIYEVGYWEDIQKMPVSSEQAVKMAQARTPEKQLERAEQRQKREAPKREKQKQQMADLFTQVDALDETLVRQEQEVDAQLALMAEYKAGPKAQVREDMHTGAAKTLEKAARKLSKALTNRLGGHVDGKDLSHGLANIAPIGGEVSIRVWMDDANTNGVLLNIHFDAMPDTQNFDKLVPKNGYWRLISNNDPFGVRSTNNNFTVSNVGELESGAFLSKVADNMLSEINRFAGQNRNNEPTNEILTLKEEKDGRRNQAENQGLGTEAREETERVERGRDGGSVHGNNVPDAEGSRGISGSDGEQQSSVTQSVKRNSNNFSYGETHLELPTGEIGKLKGNIEAIRTLKELEASGQPATPEQKQALLKFVGWGGLAEALNSAEYADWQRKLEQVRRYSMNEAMAATSWSKKWGKHYEELRPLMTDEEWASAQASTLNSHYTPETVIRGLWEALEYMGFRGGKVQEPAMGIGHIIGFMPKSMSERSVITGFELDGVPGRIAKQLYPDANIHVAGYETQFKPNSQDAIVTNVPFGQTAPIDPALDKTLRRKIGGAYNLHNYFIVKGLLELKPGGVGAFITSAATMDGRNTKAREYIASLGVDLIGAIRLPNTTFSKNAGTEVTADILFFRKRLPGEPSNGVNFVSLSQVGTGTYKGKDKKGNDVMLEVPLLVNEYFAQHPEMMLGTVMTAHDAGSGGLYGGDSQTLVARPGAELSAELADAIGRLPENSLMAKGTVESTSSPSLKEATTQKNGTVSVKNGKVYVADKGELTEIATGTFKHEGRTRNYADAATDYLALKETLKELIKAEQEQKEDPVELRNKLNDQYEQFVEKYGRLNENKSLSPILEEDYERFLAQSLEKVETIVNPKTGRRTKVVSKGDGILEKRVSQPMMEPEKADNLQDAIGISQSYRGRMDVDYIARMTGMTAEEARERILQEHEAYEDPVTGDLIDRDAYLSGNIREKLETARAAAENDERFSQNVADLEAAMPETIPFIDISYKIGTPWIPEGVYEEFAHEVLGIKNVKVRYIPAADEFVTSGGYVDDYTKSSDFSTVKRGVEDLFNDAVNLRKPTIYKQIDKDHRVKDEAATQEAVARIMDMNDAFIRYIQEREELHTRLQNIYNDRYNNYRLREYRAPNFKGADGKVHYPGSNPAITLRGHQVKAVQRCLQGSTLLAHQVGTGKTFTMITTAMEMRRLGIAKKPMIVVQNATLNDFAADFLKLYPGANILVPNETERSASQRKRLFNLIATGDFDAIIVPQSFLAFIPDDEGRKKAVIQARVDEIMEAAEALAVTDKRLADRLKREAKALELSLSGEETGSESKGRKLSVKKQAKKEESAVSRETRKLDRRTDDVLTFEQMGVDALFIDEAHNFKKIGFSTKMQNVKGVDTGYSERANSLYLKVSYVQERNGGRNVVLATGTPITNTMAEVWTMMRFVAPEILADYNIKTFDEFAATFGQVEPSLEQNSTGGFKIADRFKSYVNVPELVKAFRSHADVVLTSDVKEFKESKNIPKLKDGHMTNHVIQKSEKLEEVMDVLVEALKEDEKKSGNDKTPGLPLVVFSKAKQAAIDLRLINPEYPDDPESKTNKVVSEVMRIYKESTPDKGIQMIFCDSYQSPSSEPAIDLFDYDPNVPQFNLYRDIKQKLIEQGIPKEEIVIVSEISNAERKKAVFEKARKGDVRVLIGGTEKMGVGVNVQDRMIALHHMDAPIRPMDFEQRNGRILRQGNMFAAMDKPVEVVTYGVEGTLDATAYERLRIKQDFINQMMKGDVSGRVMEEQDDEDPSGKTFAQMAAELSGDKTLQLLFVAENKLKKLEGLRRSHEMKRQYAREQIPMLKTTLSIRKDNLGKAKATAEAVAKGMPEGIVRLTTNGKNFTEKLSLNLAEIVGAYEEQYALNRGTLPLTVKINDNAGELVFHHENGQLKYSLYAGPHTIAEGKDVNTFSGIWLSVNSALSGTGKKPAEIKSGIADIEKRIAGMESIIGKPFDKVEELKEAQQKVRDLKEELTKKASESERGTVDVKAAKKRLKSEGKIISLPEEMAGDSEESLDRMVTAMQPFESVAVNAPEMVISQSTSDILKAMPDIGSLQFAAIVKEASRPEVQAMYVPWTRQIILLPNKGTIKEMRDKRWHESLHFGIDMVIPKGDEGRLMIERAGSEVDQLSPELAAWVKDTYGDRDVAEEKMVHLVEEFISYLEDTGKVRSLLGGVDFGSSYPVLNDVVNRVINFLTNNGNGKEIDSYRGYDEGREPTYRGESKEGRVEEDFATVRNEQRIKEERIEIGFTPQEIAEMETPILQSKGGFKNLSEGEAWAKKNLQGKSETNRFTGEEIRIGKKAIDEMFHPKFTKTVGEQEHLKALMSVLDFIREGIPGEIHVDTHGRNFNVMRLYNAIEIDNEIYRVKSTVKKVKQGERYYTYELQEMELIEETPEALGLPRGTDHMPQLNSTNSITGAKLLKNVKKTNSDDEILPKNEVEVKLGLRGKPRRKQGESLISFNRRLKEWQAEMEEAKKSRAVEDMEIVNPIDEELNDLTLEMMSNPVPIRKSSESNEDFEARQAKWSEWYNERMPVINARIAELKEELKRQNANARRREMNETEDPLYNGEVPPQKDDATADRLTDEEMREVREIFQEKMEDAQISVSKEQIRRDIKQEIIERRRYIETSNLEDTFFVDEVKKSAGSKEVLKAIPDYIEGKYTGDVTPELVKTAKMVSDWFEEVYNLMAQEGVLYDAPKIQNYVTHIWDWKRSPKEAQERYTNWVNTMRLRSPFTKHRVIPSYKEGIAMGMVPKYEDITGILLEYGHYATETIANKRMIEFLKNFKVFIPGGKDNMPMEVDVIVPEKVKDPIYSRMNHTALEGYKVLNVIKPYITPVFGDQRIIDPSHLNPLTNKLIDGIWATSGLMKKIALSFSFFHHGALTETAIAMMKPHHTAKVIAKNLIWDVITKGNIPAINNKEAARDAVKHLVSLGASNDYITADVNALTTKLHQWTKDKNIPVAKQAAHLLDFLNKGSDKILWDTIHDGFKIASYEKMANEIRRKAEREKWSQIELEKSLDEAGHLVNDTFGGLHFDILGFSPKSVRIMRALLLSPDWTLATIRQALSPFGFGKLYGEEGFWRTIGGGENPVKMRKKYGRDFWITAMIFFYATMNALNAYFRIKDEEEMKKEAEEMRKLKPDYKSPYELAYPNGMEWYDYIMPGNTLGHQTHLFTGRYEDGTERYARWGKQFRELPELFFGRDGFSFPGPMIDKLSGKANPFLASAVEFVSGHNLSGWENSYMKDKKGWERDVARLYMLSSKFVPYSVPTQEDKDFYWLDLVMPSSKGFTPGKAINYFEKAINSGDMDYVVGVYNACVKNGLDPEKFFDAAKTRIEAEAKVETLEGVETLQDATNKFDEATDVKDRKRLLRYIEHQAGAQDFEAIEQEELLQKAKDIIHGENVTVTNQDYYLNFATSNDVLEDYRMKKNAAGLKKYYQDYTELMMENPEAGRRMYQQKRKYIDGYTITSKYRTGINRLKRSLSNDNIDKEKIVEQIRVLRKEYFDTMDKME